MNEIINEDNYESMGWDILQNDLESPPEKLTAFHNNRASPKPQDWLFMSSSYHCALKILISHVRDEGENITLPTLYVMRHAIELCIKETIVYYSNYTNKAANIDGHSIQGLWNQLKGQFEAAGYTKQHTWDKQCDEIIRFFHDFDPTSERFRYPVDRKGNTFKLTTVQWDRAYAAYLHIAYFCECSQEMLDDLGVVPPGHFDRNDDSEESECFTF